MGEHVVTLKNGKVVVVTGRVVLFDETNPKAPIPKDNEPITLFNSREVRVIQSTPRP